MLRDVAIYNGAIIVLGSISVASCDLYFPHLCKYIRKCEHGTSVSPSCELYDWKRVCGTGKRVSF